MQSLVKKVSSFIAFDLPLEKAYISAQFADAHQKYQVHTPQWSTVSTRRKLVVRYWDTYVRKHLTMTFVVPTLVILLFSTNFAQLPQALVGVFLSGLICFVTLFCVYLYFFAAFFLPHLETVKEEYERKFIKHQEKCRQAQLSNFALTLIYYVYDRTSGINMLQCNDKFAALQMKLFGVDQGSLKKNLKLILGKKKELDPRKKTEILNRFAEAISYFEEMEFPKGVQILYELREKFPK